MEKRTVEIALLLDFYSALLTEKQREYLELYYNEDFSLAEISNLSGVTRQGVLDAIRRGESTLLETEQKLGFLARFDHISNTAEQIITKLRDIENRFAHNASSTLFSDIYSDLDSLTERPGEPDGF